MLFDNEYALAQFENGVKLRRGKLGKRKKLNIECHRV